jgi:hypothetical protein
MSDPRQWRDMARQIEQSRVIERPGASGFDTFTASGTFSPVFAGSGGGGSYTQNISLGEWTRIGNLIHVWMHLQMNTFVGAPAGNLWITTLPFTARNTTNAFYAVTIGYRNTGLATTSTAVIPANSTRVEFYDAAGAIVAASILSVASKIVLAAVYPAA